MEAPVHVGQIVAGKYEVERILARGGHGIVVKAKHLQLLEPCAIKIMRTEVLGTPLSRERFLREARACARLKGDHVVRVFDVGELDAETPYMVLEYLDGLDLDEYLSPRRALPVREAAFYVRQMCAALAEAHALGIVHRDLKPANVFLARLADGTRRVKLLDFGISKILGDGAGVDQMQTLDGSLMGTPFFMAPEQANGLPVDARADLWALGVILYLLVTGHLPFSGETPFQTLSYIRMREPRPPSRYVPSIPAAFEAIILQCLEKDPARRPSGAIALEAAIAPFADDGGETLAVPLSRPVASSRTSLVAPLHAPDPPPHRRWRTPALIAASITAVAAAVALAPRSPGPPPAPHDTARRALAKTVDLPADAGTPPDPLPADTASAPNPPLPVLPAPSASAALRPGSLPRAAPASSIPTRPAPAAQPPASSSPARPAPAAQPPGFDLGHRH